MNKLALIVLFEGQYKIISWLILQSYTLIGYWLFEWPCFVRFLLRCNVCINSLSYRLHKSITSASLVDKRFKIVWNCWLQLRKLYARMFKESWACTLTKMKINIKGCSCRIIKNDCVDVAVFIKRVYVNSHFPFYFLTFDSSLMRVSFFILNQSKASICSADIYLHYNPLYWFSENKLSIKIFEILSRFLKDVCYNGYAPWEIDIEDY